MSIKKYQLTLQIMINAPVRFVYRAFTNSTALREWLCDVATADPHPGGRLYMWWSGGYYTSGEYTKIEPEKKVSFTWQGRGESRPTRVDVTLTPKKNSTVLKLSHHGLGRGETWLKTAEEFEKGWKKYLENLTSVLESGPDLRITRRPMLGIGLDDFNQTIAKELGVPVNEGIRISNVIGGMGAQRGGLAKNDILVSMDGSPITDFSSLSNIVDQHMAGDEVKVTFYRGPESKSVTMQLSSRPIPEIPTTPAALADALKPLYVSNEASLVSLLSKLTEEEASRQPAPEEWSVKGILAHLIHSERSWLNNIGEMIGGHEASYDDFGGNPQARIDGTLVAYPTLQALLEEFHRNCLETQVTVSALPEEFTARKGSYWRLAYIVLQNPFHFNLHLEQMQAVIDAVKQ